MLPLPLTPSLFAATVQRRGSVSESGARGGSGGGAAGSNDEEFQSIERRKTERRKSLDLGIREGRKDGCPTDIRRNSHLPLRSKKMRGRTASLCQLCVKCSKSNSHPKQSAILATHHLINHLQKNDALTVEPSNLQL